MGSFCSRSKRSPYTGSNVVGGSKEDRVMADKRAKKGAKNYCAAGGPKNSQLLQQNRNAWNFNALLSQAGKFAAEMDAICPDKSGRFRAEEVVMLVFRSL